MLLLCFLLINPFFYGLCQPSQEPPKDSTALPQKILFILVEQFDCLHEKHIHICIYLDIGLNYTELYKSINQHPHPP